jgi:ribonuclease T1
MVRSPNRPWRALLVALLLVLAGTASTRDAHAFETGPLHAFAQRAGLSDAEGFVEAVASLRDAKKLPPRYITKKDAESVGWKPGADLCRVAPGRVIGGDPFFNREKRLPDRAGRRWYEADLEPQCGRRGAKRLVWSGDGLIFVTTDHYASFIEVPK